MDEMFLKPEEILVVDLHVMTVAESAILSDTC